MSEMEPRTVYVSRDGSGNFVATFKVNAVRCPETQTFAQDMVTVYGARPVRKMVPCPITTQVRKVRRFLATFERKGYAVVCAELLEEVS